MTPNTINYVNRVLDPKKAEKAANEAKGWLQKAKTKLWVHLLIPIRNSFVEVADGKLQGHYDNIVALFDEYCEKVPLDQLKADCSADVGETFTRIFNLPL